MRVCNTYENTQEEMRQEEVINLETMSNQQPELYEVEAILSRRQIELTGQYEYQIKWTGYPYSQCTWEPLEHLSAVRDMVNSFNADQALPPSERKHHKGKKMKKSRYMAIDDQEESFESEGLPKSKVKLHKKKKQLQKANQSNLQNPPDKQIKIEQGIKAQKKPKKREKDRFTVYHNCDDSMQSLQQMGMSERPNDGFETTVNYQSNNFHRQQSQRNNLNQLGGNHQNQLGDQQRILEKANMNGDNKSVENDRVPDDQCCEKSSSMQLFSIQPQLRSFYPSNTTILNPFSHINPLINQKSELNTKQLNNGQQQIHNYQQNNNYYFNPIAQSNQSQIEANRQYLQPYFQSHNLSVSPTVNSRPVSDLTSVTSKPVGKLASSFKPVQRPIIAKVYRPLAVTQPVNKSAYNMMTCEIVLPTSVRLLIPYSQARQKYGKELIQYFESLVGEKSKGL